MLATARSEALSYAEFSTTLPPGPFSWLNSYFVFQHIPPDEGLSLIEPALSHAGPECFLSLQITFWRESARPKNNVLSHLSRRLHRNTHRKADGDAAHLIRMYDYPLSEVMRLVTAAGLKRVVMRHTNHGGHHGGWLIARRG